MDAEDDRSLLAVNEWITIQSQVSRFMCTPIQSTLFPPPLYTVLASCAYIAYYGCMQYTIRKVPKSLDGILRRRAHEQGKSLNEVAIEALARGAGVSGEHCRQRDLRDIAGTWRSDPAFERALTAQDTVDKELWR